MYCLPYVVLVSSVWAARATTQKSAAYSSAALHFTRRRASEVCDEWFEAIRIGAARVNANRRVRCALAFRPNLQLFSCRTPQQITSNKPSSLLFCRVSIAGGGRDVKNQSFLALKQTESGIIFAFFIFALSSPTDSIVSLSVCSIICSMQKPAFAKALT